MQAFCVGGSGSSEHDDRCMMMYVVEDVVAMFGFTGSCGGITYGTCMLWACREHCMLLVGSGS